jgi:L,D-transpeptidase catalytic domain
MSVKIIIKKNQKKLYVYRNRSIIFQTQIAHGRTGTTPGVRKIMRWVPGPVTLQRPDYKPVTWFSFGATFARVYQWPASGVTGHVHLKHGQFEAKRIDANTAQVKYLGRWHDVWKDSNPFGAMMADLAPGKIELHGTNRDQNGRDVLPSMSGINITHGCVRVTNDAIKKIKSLAPIGTEVSIEN